MIFYDSVFVVCVCRPHTRSCLRLCFNLLPCNASPFGGILLKLFSNHQSTASLNKISENPPNFKPGLGFDPVETNTIVR